MARYPALFTLGIKIGDLHASLKKVFESCDLNMIYDTPEYVMAREIPGKVPFPKLVTVEVGQGDERRWLVLGVATGGVSLLYTLTPTVGADVPPTPAQGFAQLLSRLKDGEGGARAS